MPEEMLIVPTQELAFAVKKDGSYISNFSEKRGGVENVDPATIMAYFKGLRKFITECPEKELVAFAFVELLESREVHDCIVKRMEKLQSEKENE